MIFEFFAPMSWSNSPQQQECVEKIRIPQLNIETSNHNMLILEQKNVQSSSFSWYERKKKHLDKQRKQTSRRKIVLS